MSPRCGIFEVSIMRLTLATLVLGVVGAQGSMAAGDGTAAVCARLGGAAGDMVGRRLGGRRGAEGGAGGGGAAGELGGRGGGEGFQLVRDGLERWSFILPPRPNTRVSRETTCWSYGGVTLNPMYWPARRQETLLASAIYKFHPEFTQADFQIWYGDPDQDHGNATLEGGDVMPIGNGVVLIGMGERSSRQAIGQLALNLFKNKAVERVIVAGLPKSRAAMHLDTVFSFCDRDLVTIFPEVVSQIVAFSLRPDESKPGGIDVRREDSSFLDTVAAALKLPALRVVETGGNSFAAEREQWDDGNNVVAVEPGVVIGHDRN
ncbi:hypothetical protein B1218_30800, partial [Pseudomonas ogarae]